MSKLLILFISLALLVGWIFYSKQMTKVKTMEDENSVNNAFYVDGDNKVVAFDRGYIIKEDYYLKWFDILATEDLFNPTKSEIQKSLTILNSCSQIIDNDINTTKYIKQIVGINKNGGIIYVIGIYENPYNDLNWKSDLIMMDDGGKSYFQTKIDLENNTCIDFQFNGEA